MDLLGILSNVADIICGVIAIGAIVVGVTVMITKAILKDKMKEENLESAVIETVNRCDNVVKLKDLDSDKVIEVHGQGIDSDIYQGDRLYV